MPKRGNERPKTHGGASRSDCVFACLYIDLLFRPVGRLQIATTTNARLGHIGYRNARISHSSLILSTVHRVASGCVSMASR